MMNMRNVTEVTEDVRGSEDDCFYLSFSLNLTSRCFLISILRNSPKGINTRMDL